jgi:hypothetical protein
MTKFSGFAREQRLDVFGAALCVIVDNITWLESRRWMDL